MHSSSLSSLLMVSVLLLLLLSLLMLTVDSKLYCFCLRPSSLSVTDADAFIVCRTFHDFNGNSVVLSLHHRFDDSLFYSSISTQIDENNVVALKWICLSKGIHQDQTKPISSPSETGKLEWKTLKHNLGMPYAAAVMFCARHRLTHAHTHRTAPHRIKQVSPLTSN